MSDTGIVTRVPQYFPTYPPECKEPSLAFFACFDKHAIMPTDTDTRTCHAALTQCQDTLKAYTKCVDAVVLKKNTKSTKAGGWW